MHNIAMQSSPCNTDCRARGFVPKLRKREKSGTKPGCYSKQTISSHKRTRKSAERTLNEPITNPERSRFSAHLIPVLLQTSKHLLTMGRNGSSEHPHVGDG